MSGHFLFLRKTNKDDIIGNYWGEARDTATHLTKHRTNHHSKDSSDQILRVLRLRPWSYMLYIAAKAFDVGVLRIP